MTSRRALTLGAIIIWAAVAVTAAPRAFSRHHSLPLPAAEDSAVTSCSDLHFHFDHQQAVVQTEERTISKPEAPTLRVQADSNGGLYVEGWDKDTYSVTLCKALKPGPMPNPYSRKCTCLSRMVSFVSLLLLPTSAGLRTCLFAPPKPLPSTSRSITVP